MKKALPFIFVFALKIISAQPLPDFSIETIPAPPDYSNPKYWSALPFRNDIADMIPKSEKWVSDSLKEVDVFYIYPTIFTKGKTWNADVNDQKLNKKIDKYPVKFHASVFNHVARVYVPRYRQAILKSYWDKDGNGTKAFEVAYEDLKKAFEYYLEHYNNGRPIIIASHSQGTTHSRRLLKDYFDNPEMKAKLVCAYVIGYQIDKNSYQVLKPCLDSLQTSCYVTWSSYKKGYIPASDDKLIGNVCINPISWRSDTIEAYGRSGILLNTSKTNPYPVYAQIHNNYLWVKCHIPFVSPNKVLHLVDYNLFWFDIRRNAETRVRAYFRK